MKRKLLFNPNGSDAIEDRLIIGGNTTNVMNLNNVKYNWAPPLWRKMRENFWMSEIVDLTQDVKDYEKLTKDERDAFDSILSFLVFLDSIQTNNIPNVSAYITAPEISMCLTEHASQEALHDQSYQYIIETIIPVEKRNKIYDLYRDIPELLARNTYIASIYQDFANEETEENFIRVVVANFCLESLYFYNAFIFFFLLESRHLMSGCADLIKLINRDENTHIALFQNIILSMGDMIPKDLVYDMVKEAVSQEIEWSNNILGNKILGVSKTSIKQYTKYLANKRLTSIGLTPIYKNVSNPYKHLENSSGSKNGFVKGNYFESTVTEYQQSSAIKGWDF